MRAPHWLLFVMLCTLGLPQANGGEGTLGQIKDAVRTSPEPEAEEEKPRQHKKKHRHRPHIDCEPSSDFSGAEMLLAMYFAASPLWLPMYALEDEPFGFVADFTDYPYADGSEGLLDPQAFGKTLLVRLEAYNGNNLDDINQIGGQILIDTRSRLGFQSRWSHFQENFSDAGRDELVLGDTNLTFRFAQNQKMQMRVGLGMRALIDNSDTTVGVNVSYGADWFPAKPFVISSTIDYSRLGNANLIQSRSTVGLLLNRYELFTGYEFLRIGTVNQHHLLGGIRIWF